VHTTQLGISARDLKFSYPKRTIWQDLTFDIAPGSLTALLGESGSGKTTLLQCLGSLEKTTGGTLEVYEHNMQTLRGAQLRNFRRTSVGFVFQNSGLVASWSVRNNIELGGYKVKDNPARAQEVFEFFGLPFAFLETPAYQLSGGEQQRVGLIRLALRNPPLILLDEPTASLDDANAQRVIEFMKHHCNNGGIAVTATHDSRVIEHVDQKIRLA